MFFAAGRQGHRPLAAAGFSKTDIIPCKTIEEAIAKAHEITGKEKMSTYIMPFGANTMASTDI